MGTSKKRKTKTGKVVKKKVVKIEELAKAICPHCDKEINNVAWRIFGNNDVQVVAHSDGDCMKALGAAFNFQK